MNRKEIKKGHSWSENEKKKKKQKIKYKTALCFASTEDEITDKLNKIFEDFGENWKLFCI